MQRTTSQILNEIISISMYPYPLEYNVSVMLSRQHTYMPLHQQTYTHTTHWTNKHQLIKYIVGPNNR